MWAIVEINSKQYLVQKGDLISVERLKVEDKNLQIDKVLLMCKDDNIEIGRPYLSNHKVYAQVEGEFKGDKIIIYKYRRRKKSRKKQGHRQIYSSLRITDIQ